ncbi:hypothetical protein [Priestia flexa]|uniref:hypothetical protein n=1 Tax=Priestia flexa TaxID=86664 RepID=UPI0009560C07|nr:hypothetical protein [Priestia flexa]SIR56303.1 hypothetical protein SAMN05880580_1391 [Priestia flexa]
MLKNLPLLMAMLLIGSGIMVITLTTSLPQIIELFLLSIGAILNIWSMIGLILHLGVQKLNKNFNE